MEGQETNKVIKTKVKRASSDLFYRTLFEKAQDGILFLDADTGLIEDVNPFLMKLLGYSHDELLGKQLWEIGLFKDIIANQAFFVQLQKEKFVRYDNKLLHNKEGLSIWVEFFSNIYEVNGKQVIHCNIRDITERRNSEMKIWKSNERFELIGKATNDALWEWNLETNRGWGNEIHQQLYGLTVNDPVPDQEEWKQRIHPDDRERTVEMLERALILGITGFVEEYRFHSVNKGWMNVYGRTLIERNKDGKPVRLVGSMMDITETKNAIVKLAESEEKFRTLVQQAADGIFLVDLEGNYLDANQSAAMLTGYSIDELKKMNAAVIVAKEDLIRNPLKLDEIRKGSTVFLERIIVRKDGRHIHVDISAKLMDNGKVMTILRDMTERRMAEMALQNAEKRLQFLLSATPAVIYSSQAVFPFGATFISQNVFEQTGYEVGDFLDDPGFWQKNIHPDDSPGILKNLTELFVKGYHIHEYRFKKKDGNYSWMYDEMKLIYDSSGKPSEIVGYWINIDKRKKAEQELMKSTQEFKTLVENMNDGFIVDDISGKIILTNKKFLKIYGFTADEINQLDFEDYVAPEYVGELRERHHRRMAGEKVPEYFEFEGIRKDGRRIWIETHVTPIIENGMFTGTQSILRDFTERKKAEEERFLLQDSLQKSLNEIYIFDPDTFLFHYINAGALKNLGYSEAEIIKLSPVDLKPAFTKQTFKELLTQLLNGEREKIVFFTDHIRKDRSLYPVEVHVQLISQGNKNVFLAVILDITERKRIEKELSDQKIKQQKLITEITIQAQEKERNELGRELHDNINQILATIKMYLDMVRAGQGIQEELIGKSHEYVNEVMEEIRKLSHSLVAPSLGDIGLKEALEELIKESNFSNNLQINLVVEENFNENVLDKNKKLMFYRIVQEQLGNIIKYSGASEVVVKFGTDKGKLFLTVADNGVGFDTSVKGPGIGLKNISSRIEFYSGEMNIISAPGKGCILEVNIPY